MKTARAAARQAQAAEATAGMVEGLQADIRRLEKKIDELLKLVQSQEADIRRLEKKIDELLKLVQSQEAEKPATKKAAK